MATEIKAKKVSADNAQVFGLNTYVFNKNTSLIIAEVAMVQHTINGKLSENKVPVVYLAHKADWDNCAPKEGAKLEMLYLRAFLKHRETYEGKPVEYNATFNNFVKGLQGKTFGEIATIFAEHIGKEIVADVVTYYGINKRGDVQPISFNIWNWSE